MWIQTQMMDMLWTLWSDFVLTARPAYVLWPHEWSITYGRRNALHIALDIIDSSILAVLMKKKSFAKDLGGEGWVGGWVCGWGRLDLKVMCSNETIFICWKLLVAVNYYKQYGNQISSNMYSVPTPFFTAGEVISGMHVHVSKWRPGIIQRLVIL